MSSLCLSTLSMVRCASFMEPAGKSRTERKERGDLAQPIHWRRECCLAKPLVPCTLPPSQLLLRQILDGSQLHYRQEGVK